MTRRITPQLAMLLALLFAVLAALVASNHYFQGQLLTVHARSEQIVRNIERIRYYDEALTGSARLAAATGDDAYERRYHGLAPQLDAVIADTLRLVHSPQAAAAIAQTSDANQALIAMEERSFLLGGQGKQRAASALLNSAQYARQKAIYAKGFNRAAAVFRATVHRSTARVRLYRPLALGIGILGAAVLLIASVLFLRLARERERMASENERRTRAEADRRVSEVEYFETQQDFSEILQVTRREPEAHGLIKRHLERTMPGATVVVLSRNNSDDRLEVMTQLPSESPLNAALVGAEPESCAAIRLGRAHVRDGERAPLLECEICGGLPGASLCTPSLVGGEVIGSVLVEREGALGDGDERRVHETVSQAAPVLANLRTLALAEGRALTDTLTGLPNKRSIEDTLKRMAAQAGRSRTPLAAIMFDLDHFKRVNDVYGHNHGDEVLAAVGAAITACVRESDFAGRYGGEEFLVLLADSDRAGALVTAEKLRTAIAAVQIPGESRAVTASLGVAVMPDDAGESTALLRCADRALYAAKRAGRNRVESAESEPSAPLVAPA
jgi:diguanylate cyclase (GGDEF)-like protein